MIRRRTEPYETKTGHERWLVSYSDFITLLFAFFVMMYSVSQVSEEKYRVLSTTLASAFEGRVPVDAQLKARLDRQAAGAIAGISPTASSPDTHTIAAQLQKSLVQMANPGDVSIRASAEWVEIEVNASLLFPSASAEPSGEAQRMFQQVAGVLAAVPNAVEVSGHTDDVPIQTARFASNWELSAARASSVVRLLARYGVQPTRLAAVGYGEFRPVASNEDELGRAQNRRVVLKVSRLSEQVQTPIPMQTFNPSEWVFGPAPSATETAASERSPFEISPSGAGPSESNDSGVSRKDAEGQNIAPVRLDNGGLLFTSDPELPRHSR